MTHEEVRNIVHALVTFYPTSAPKTEKALIELVSLWEMAIGSMDYKLVEGAVVGYVRSDKRGFFPTPGMVIDAIDQEQGMSEGEAWSMVRKAISRGYYHAEEDFAQFPEEIQKAVGSPSQLRTWAVDTEYNDGVVQSNFLRSYRVVCERKKKYSALPESTRALLEGGHKCLDG